MLARDPEKIILRTDALAKEDILSQSQRRYTEARCAGQRGYTEPEKIY